MSGAAVEAGASGRPAKARKPFVRPARTPAQEAADRAIGRRLYELRAAAGLSQTELGDALGVSYQQAHKYEAGKNRITAAAVLDACAALGCTPNDLLSGLVPLAPRARRATNAAGAGTRRMHLARRLASMPERDFAMLEAAARALEALGERAKRGKGDAA